MRKDVRKGKIIIGLLLLIGIIGVGYATLGANLKINGVAEVPSSSWDVHFKTGSISVTDGSVSIEENTTQQAATIDSATQVSYAVKLALPGDFYEFTVDVENTGTIDAMIESVSSKLGNTEITTGTLPSYLDYSVTYSDGQAITTKQQLNSGDTETIKVRLEFKKDIEATDLPGEATTLNLNFQINYVQADGTAIEVPHPVVPKCIRATTLHTETCSNIYASYNCREAGYALNATITYGNTTTTEGVLTTGDAFDCDVDGTGYNQRFYYVSDYYDTSTQNFNEDVAVLIYYSNVRGGVANTSGTAYMAQTGACTDYNGCNWYGPVTAIQQLPTTNQWSNISLYKDTRQILAEDNATTTAGGTLPTAFSYSGYAARLLTYQEAYQGCNSYDKTPGSTGGLDAKCQFLMEGTNFSNTSIGIYGPWLESPYTGISSYVWNVDSYTRRLLVSDAASNTHYGIRPTIEILKSEISY